MVESNCSGQYEKLVAKFGNIPLSFAGWTLVLDVGSVAYIAGLKRHLSSAARKGSCATRKLSPMCFEFILNGVNMILSQYILEFKTYLSALKILHREWSSVSGVFLSAGLKA